MIMQEEKDFVEIKNDVEYGMFWECSLSKTTARDRCWLHVKIVALMSPRPSYI